jgi:O-antigen ligase
MLVFAPLVRGGNRPMPLLVLECAAIAMLTAMFATNGTRETFAKIPLLLRWAIGVLVAMPLIQLIPLPAGAWAALPGHEPYAHALELAGVTLSWHGATLDASATQYAALALLPPIAILFAVQSLGPRQVRRLVAVMIGVALVESVLGVLQLGAQARSPLYLGNPYGGGAATGTYVNKNHFAGLIAMALPVAMALWAGEVVPPRDARGEILREHPRHRDAKLARRVALSTVVAVMVVALLFSRSRGGAGCGLAALALASLVLVWNAGSIASRVLLAFVAAGALLLGAYIGLTPVFERFAPEEISLSYAGRAQLAAAALRGALDFFPLGSGLGTFADAFQRYQAGTIPGFVDHAHNDYAEAAMELGLAAIAIFALCALAFVARWRELSRGRLSRRLGYLQVGAGLGVAALALHGAFDFNFHIPANALYFAFLAGVFFFTPAEDRA